jgi:hypothetical protein
VGVAPRSKKGSVVGPAAAVSMVETDAVNVGRGALAL